MHVVPCSTFVLTRYRSAVRGVESYWSHCKFYHRYWMFLSTIEDVETSPHARFGMHITDVHNQWLDVGCIPLHLVLSWTGFSFSMSLEAFTKRSRSTWYREGLLYVVLSVLAEPVNCSRMSNYHFIATTLLYIIESFIQRLQDVYCICRAVTIERLQHLYCNSTETCPAFFGLSVVRPKSFRDHFHVIYMKYCIFFEFL